MAFAAFRKLPVILAGAGVLAAAACGSDDDGAPPDVQAESPPAPSPAVTATVRLPGENGEAISGVAAGEGAVWVARGGCEGSVSRIDLESNEAVATTPVGFVSAIAVGGPPLR